ncbi:hypothetical protein TNCT_676491 [Trichonephila clavata]|uniref:Uncharacterized protein n=1 Tax=Trichonephila clavata TaxID=2740835 RepID=A0A8X6M2P3_TRICU|nr:hypothetical protein TNCT_676491 [Trichonephila clavata]
MVEQAKCLKCCTLPWKRAPKRSEVHIISKHHKQQSWSKCLQYDVLQRQHMKESMVVNPKRRGESVHLFQNSHFNIVSHAGTVDQVLNRTLTIR